MATKILLVGSGGVGKSVLVRSLKSNSFERKYIPTIGVEVVPVSGCGNKSFAIWDTAGQEKFGVLKEGYYIGSQAAIVMCGDSAFTVREAREYLKSIKRVCGEIPTLVIFNKTDLKLSEEIKEFWDECTALGVHTLETSVKNGRGMNQVLPMLETLTA